MGFWWKGTKQRIIKTIQSDHKYQLIIWLNNSLWEQISDQRFSEQRNGISNENKVWNRKALFDNYSLYLLMAIFYLFKSSFMNNSFNSKLDKTMFVAKFCCEWRNSTTSNIFHFNFLVLIASEVIKRVFAKNQICCLLVLI